MKADNKSRVLFDGYLIIDMEESREGGNYSTGDAKWFF